MDYGECFTLVWYRYSVPWLANPGTTRRLKWKIHGNSFTKGIFSSKPWSWLPEATKYRRSVTSICQERFAQWRVPGLFICFVFRRMALVFMAYMSPECCVGFGSEIPVWGTFLLPSVLAAGWKDDGIWIRSQLMDSQLWDGWPWNSMNYILPQTMYGWPQHIHSGNWTVCHGKSPRENR